MSSRVDPRPSRCGATPLGPSRAETRFHPSGAAPSGSQGFNAQCSGEKGVSGADQRGEHSFGRGGVDNRIVGEGGEPTVRVEESPFGAEKVDGIAHAGADGGQIVMIGVLLVDHTDTDPLIAWKRPQPVERAGSGRAPFQQVRTDGYGLEHLEERLVAAGQRDVVVRRGRDWVLWQGKCVPGCV